MKKKILFFALFAGIVSIFSGCASVMGPITDAITQIKPPPMCDPGPCVSTKRDTTLKKTDIVISRPKNPTVGGLYDKWQNDKNIPTCVMGKCPVSSVQDIKITKPEELQTTF